jgi:hypothetical protein
MSTSNVAAVDFGKGISDAWGAVVSVVPKLVAFLVIVLIGWLIAKALAKIVNKVLEKVGFDRLVERGGVKQALDSSKYDASDIIAKLVYYAILLIALQLAFGVWGPNPVSALLTAIVAWLPRAVVAIIIVVITAAIAKVVKDMVATALGGLSYGNLVATIASVFIWALGIIAALNEIGIATTVTAPVLIAVLATVGGVLVVGMGGGLIKPMQQRWDRWLSRIESELPAARAEAQAFQRGREDALRSGTQPTEQLDQPTHADQQGTPTQQGYRPGAAPPRPTSGPGPTTPPQSGGW